MESNLINLDIVGNTNRQIKRNRVLQLISISVFTLSVILSCKLLIHLLFPTISAEYYEITIILSSCLAVNIAASLILYKYQMVMERLENRLELKADNLYDTIKKLKGEREERRRYAVELKRAEEKYHYLMDNVNEGIVSLDVEGNILEANKKMGELLGFSAAELLTMNLSQFLPEAGLEIAQNAWNEVVQDGESNLLNSWMIRKDGGKFPVDFTGTKVEYGGKTIIQGIFRNPNGCGKTAMG